MKRKRWPRRLFVLGLGAFLALLVAKWYAESRVEVVLEEIFGSPVSLERARIGLRQIDVHGLKVYESAGDRRAYLEIRQARLAMSPWDVYRGRTTPKRVDITGAAFRVKVDEEGRWLTDLFQFSSDLDLPPETHIDRLQIEFQPPRREPLIVRGVAARLLNGRRGLTGSGTVSDLWSGEWNFDFQNAGADAAARFAIESQQIQFDSQALRNWPFPAEFAAEQVAFRGRTPVRLQVQSGGGEDFRYRLTLSPTFDLSLPEADLFLSEMSGDISIANGTASFPELSGRLGDGRLTLGGELTQQDQQWRGRLTGECQQVVLSKLPASWGVPSQVTGVAAGRFQLNVDLQPTQLEAFGSLDATVEAAAVYGLAASPIQVRVDLAKAVRTLPEGPLQLAGQAEFAVKLPDVELAEVLKLASIDTAPVAVNGRANCRATMQAPLSTLRDPRTFSAKLACESAALTVGGVDLREVRVEGDYDRGVSSLRKLAADVGTGRVTGTGRKRAATDKVFSLQLNVDKAPLSLLTPWLRGSRFQPEGFVSGSLEAAVPDGRLADLDSWRVAGDLRIPAAQLGEQRFTATAARLDLHDGQLAFSELATHWRDRDLKGSVKLSTKPPYAFSSQFAAGRFALTELARLAKLAPPVKIKGDAEVEGELAGSLQPWSARAVGTARLHDVRIADTPIEASKFEWRYDTAQRTFKANIQAAVWGADMKMTAQRPSAAAPSHISGSFVKLDAGRLSGLAPALAGVFQGQAEGEFSLLGVEDMTTAQADVTLRGLTAESAGVRVDHVTANLTLKEGRLQLVSNGEALGGAVAFRGEGPWRSELSKIQLAGQLSVKGVEAARCWALLGIRNRRLKPTGKVGDEMQLQVSGPTFQPQGEGQIEIQELRVSDKARVTTRLQSSLTLLTNSIVLQDLSFNYGGGQVTGEVVVRTDTNFSGVYSLTLARVAADDLLILWPRAARLGKVLVNARMAGGFNSQRVFGRGRVDLPSGAVAGIPVRNVSAPLEWTLNTATGGGKAKLRIVRSDIAGGRASGAVSLEWGRRLHVEGHVNLTKLSMQPLTRALPFSQNTIGGRVSGTIHFNGRNARSVKDFTGTFDLNLDNSQMLRMPVLEALAGNFGIGSSSSTFSETKLRGRMRSGVAYVEQMTMQGSGVRLFIEGQAATSGQLDLNITADTGELLTAGVVVGLLRPTDLLKRRLIFLHMGGTVRSPVLTPRTDKFIEQEARFFFLPFVIP